MENLRFDEELLQQGYKFLSDVSGNGRYVLIEKGEIKGDCVVDFKFLQTYYNVTDNMIDGKYLIIFYEKGKHAYKAIIADKKIIVKYHSFLKFIRKGNVSSSEVQSILSILDTKLRQQKWSVTKLEHTGIGDVTSYKLSLTRNKR